MQSKINFRQSRNLGDTIDTAIAFIKENLVALIKAIALISGPFILLGSIGVGLFYSAMYDTVFSGIPDPRILQDMTGQMMLMNLGFSAAVVVFFTTVYSFIYSYINGQNTAVPQVWRIVRKNLLRTFKLFIGSFFLVFFTTALTMGLMFILVFSGRFLGLFLNLIVMMLSFAPVCYLIVTLSLLMSVSLYEQKGFFASLKRSFSLIAGKWWRTFGVIFGFFVIYAGISFVFSIPLYGTFLGMMFTRSSEVESSSILKIAIAASSALFLVGTYFVSTILLVGINFHYFSLAEEKDAFGLIDRIKSFGTGPSEIKDVEEY